MEGANWFGWNDLFSSLFPDKCWCPCCQISMILSRFRWQPHGVKSLLPVEFAPEMVLELIAQDTFKMFRASLCLVTCIFDIGCNSRRQIFLLWNRGVQRFIKHGLSCTVHNLREKSSQNDQSQAKTPLWNLCTFVSHWEDDPGARGQACLLPLYLRQRTLP